RSGGPLLMPHTTGARPAARKPLLLVLVLALAGALLLGAAPAASANADTRPHPGDSDSGATIECTTSDYEVVGDDEYLPMNRWRGHTEFHTRTSGLISTGTLQRAQRDMAAGSLLQAADTIWALTSGITRSAVQL